MTLCHGERRKTCCNQKLILDLGACLALFPSPPSCTREFLCLPWADITSMESICLRASDVWKNKPELALRVVEVTWGGCPLHRLVHLSKWLTAELTAQGTVWNLECILDAFLTENVKKCRQPERGRLAEGSSPGLLTEVRKSCQTSTATSWKHWTIISPLYSQNILRHLSTHCWPLGAWEYEYPFPHVQEQRQQLPPKCQSCRFLAAGCFCLAFLCVLLKNHGGEKAQWNLYSVLYILTKYFRSRKIQVRF